MKWFHKISKLADGSALRSAQDSLHRRLHPIDPAKIAASIDAQGLEAIQQRHAVPGEKTHWPKYLHADRWIRLAVRRSQDLRLNTRPQPLRILDLGSGAGYFLYVARALGHSGKGLDIPDPEMYHEMFALFDLPRVIWEISAFQPLPDLDERFDLVTAFSICFNGHKRPDLWGPREWAFFLDDLESNVLRPRGEIFLGMNPEYDGSYYTPELRAFFQQRGAQIDRAKVWFKEVHGRTAAVA